MQQLRGRKVVLVMSTMKEPTSLLQLPATRKQTITALIVAFLIVGVSMSILPYATIQFEQVNAFYPIFIAWVLIGDFVTSHLFYIQYQASGEKPLLILSATFLFTALMVIPHAAAFPGILPFHWVGDLGQLSLWLWIIWHIGYPVGIILYTLSLKKCKPSSLSADSVNRWTRFGVLFGTTALVVIITVLMYRYRYMLPAFLEDHDYRKLVSSGVGPAMAALNVLAFICLLVKTRFNSVLHVWLLLSVFTFCLDVFLSLYAGVRYSVGWYFARFNALISATAALAVFFYEINQLYIRLSRSRTELDRSQKYLNSTLNSLTDCFIALDNYCNFKYMNKSAEQFLGVPISALQGKHFWDCYSHLRNTSFHEYIERAMRDNVMQEFIWFNDNKQCWLETRVYPSQEGLAVFFRDVTVRIVSEQRLKEANEKLQMANRLLEDFSFTDGLTGVYNRRYFDQMMQREWERSGQEGIPLSLIMFDIDFFKLYNDTYGHQQGDECLTRVAHAVRDCLMDTSAIVTRYGGEEFSIILPQMDEGQAMETAELVRVTVEQLGITHGVAPAYPVVTCSVGVATVQLQMGEDRQPSDLIQVADQAMYEAKQSGRNQVRSSRFQ